MNEDQSCSADNRIHATLCIESTLLLESTLVHTRSRLVMARKFLRYAVSATRILGISKANDRCTRILVVMPFYHQYHEASTASDFSVQYSSTWYPSTRTRVMYLSTSTSRVKQFTPDSRRSRCESVVDMMCYRYRFVFETLSNVNAQVRSPRVSMDPMGNARIHLRMC